MSQRQTGIQPFDSVTRYALQRHCLRSQPIQFLWVVSLPCANLRRRPLKFLTLAQQSLSQRLRFQASHPSEAPSSFIGGLEKMVKGTISRSGSKTPYKGVGRLQIWKGGLQSRPECFVGPRTLRTRVSPLSLGHAHLDEARVSTSKAFTLIAKGWKLESINCHFRCQLCTGCPKSHHVHKPSPARVEVKRVGSVFGNVASQLL